MARPDSGGLPNPSQPGVPARSGHDKAPARRLAARGLGNPGRPDHAARSGAGATTRAGRVGLKLADHVIAGRSNIR